MRARRKRFFEIHGVDEENAERPTRIPHLGGKYFIWQAAESRRRDKGIRKVSCPLVETQAGLLWTNSREVWRQAVEEMEGKHDSSRSEAKQRQLEGKVG